MTINPRTKAVELTPAEVRRAIVAHLKGKFNITCTPDDISLRPMDEDGTGIAAAEVVNWNNDPAEEEAEFRIQQ